MEKAKLSVRFIHCKVSGLGLESSCSPVCHVLSFPHFKQSGGAMSEQRDRVMFGQWVAGGLPAS